MRLPLLWSLLVCLVCAGGALADEQESEWVGSFHYVRFKPSMDDWHQGYDDPMRGVQFSLAALPTSQLEVGLALGYYRASGQGALPLNGSTGGEVDYTLIPVEPYVLLLGRFSPTQWIIPYVGGGYSQVYYRIDVRDQSLRKGKAHGSHLRAGVNIMLNQYDKFAAQRMRNNWGIASTQFSVEVKKLNAEKDGAELGGDMVLLGLNFLF